MPRRGRYPESLRQEAIRQVRERASEFGSQWETICAVAEQLGPAPETVRGWVRRDELQQRAADVAERRGPDDETGHHVEELERELRTLRRENEILRAAFTLLARDLGREPGAEEDERDRRRQL